jgi:ferrous iron transport protein B
MTASLTPTYPAAIEQAVVRIGAMLSGDYALSRRTIALLLLQEDAEIWDEVQAQESAHTLEQIRQIIEQLERAGETPLAWQIEQQRQLWSQQIAAQVTQITKPPRPQTLAEWVGWLCMNPWTGFPILMLVLYFGLYQFVGVFGAGTVVGLIEENLFGEYINPVVENLVRSVIPWQPIQELLVGEYGVWTLGFTYAIALILPIVTFFYLMFAIL